MGMIFTAIQGSSADLTLYQGKTLRAVLTWGGSTPQDVTGYSARLTVRSEYNSPTVTADFTVANGRVVVGGADGKFTFNMLAADSAALPAPFAGVYEVEVTDTQNRVYRAVAGNVTIVPEVVR